MKRSKEILISGANGFLGRHLLQSVPSGVKLRLLLRNPLPAEIAFSSRSRNVHFEEIRCDLSQPESLSNSLAPLLPDAIIMTAAVSDAAACLNQPKVSHQVNVAAAVAMAEHANRLQIPFVYCSTDLVFDGHQAPYKTIDHPGPVMQYGAQKAEAEQRILECCPTAIIARLPLLYGNSLGTSRGQVDYIRQACQNEQPIGLFTDEYRTPAHAARIAEGLWKWIFSDNKGIWHFGGPERISRYEFAQTVAAVFGLDPIAIVPKRQEEVPSDEPRPADVSLMSDATYACGWHHGDLITELKSLRA